MFHTAPEAAEPRFGAAPPCHVGALGQAVWGSTKPGAPPPAHGVPGVDGARGRISKKQPQKLRGGAGRDRGFGVPVEAPEEKFGGSLPREGGERRNKRPWLPSKPAPSSAAQAFCVPPPPREAPAREAGEEMRLPAGEPSAGPVPPAGALRQRGRQAA